MRVLKECNQFYLMYIKSVPYMAHIKRSYSSCSNNMKVLTGICNYSTQQSSDIFFQESKNIFINQNVRNICISHSLYHKKGKKSAAKETVGKKKLDLREMSEYVDVEKLTKEFNKALEMMKNDFVKNLSLRSASGTIEDLPVTFEDKEYHLQELVQIARKPNLVILNATAFPQAMPKILDAISKSGLNLNPQQDGTKISLQIPKVTKEHREILSKNAKALFVKCRDNINDVRNKQIKKIENDESLDEDVLFRLKNNVDLLSKQHVLEAETILKTKQAELLGS